MKKICYAGYPFPPAVIQQAIWLYLRFTLSFEGVDPPIDSSVRKSSSVLSEFGTAAGPVQKCPRGGCP